MSSIPCGLAGCTQMFEQEGHRRMHQRGCEKKTPAQRAKTKKRILKAKHTQFSVEEDETGEKKYACQLEGCSAIFQKRLSLSNHIKQCAKRTVVVRQEYFILSHRATTDEARNANAENCRKYRLAQKQKTVKGGGDKKDPYRGWYAYHIRRTNAKLLGLQEGEPDPFLGTLNKQEVAIFLQDILQHTCLYCGQGPALGIDRLDSSRPYGMDNIVPTCTICNMMKGTLKPTEWMQLLSQIVTFQNQKTPAIPPNREQQPMPQRPKSIEQQVKLRCRKHQDTIEITLQPNDFEIYDDPQTICVYCGISRQRMVLGIDRVNSAEGYIPGNCVPACAPCNMLKRSQSVEEFLTHVQRIYAKLSLLELPLEMTLLAQTKAIGVRSIIPSNKPMKGAKLDRRIALPEEAHLVPLNVFMLKTSGFYHNADCSVIRGLETTEQHYTIALARNRRPCKRCRHLVFSGELALKSTSSSLTNTRSSFLGK